MVLRLAARPMLASIFIVEGLDSLLHPETRAPAAEAVVRPLAERVPAVPDQVEQAVRLNGAVQLVAGSLLAIGKFPRLSAAALALTIVPTTAAGHRFWESDDKQERAQQKIHFLKNVSMLGGLLIAAGDTAGNPSIAWRGRQAAGTAKREASLTAKSVKAGAQAATAKAEAKAARAQAQAARTAAKTAARNSGRAARLTAKGGSAAGNASAVTKAGAKAGRKLTAALPVG
ncbi:MAG TPA: DoxX family protein [Streptosporangiaceae bacterium]|nr:DoxX family protein [Streptosporangiaceae bacterium]